MDVVEKNKSQFDLLMNAGNELLIVFDATNERVDNPVLSFDKKQTAILKKNSAAEPLIFTPIHVEARVPMARAQKILCVEVRAQQVVNEYMARIEVV